MTSTDGPDGLTENLSRWARAGFPVATPDLYATRMGICGQCEHLTALKKCGKCGCFMPAKVRLPTSRCPDGRWGRVL